MLSKVELRCEHFRADPAISCCKSCHDLTGVACRVRAPAKLCPRRPRTAVVCCQVRDRLAEAGFGGRRVWAQALWAWRAARARNSAPVAESTCPESSPAPPSDEPYFGFMRPKPACGQEGTG